MRPKGAANVFTFSQFFCSTTAGRGRDGEQDQDVTQRLIKVFGERNSATRAVLRMVDEAPLLAEAGHPDVDEDDLEKYDIMIQQVTSIYSGPWKRVYREAIKDVRAREMGALGTWKHAAPEFDPVFAAMNVSVLFLVRNPYSWVQSLNRRPYHCMGRRQQELEDFLVFPWLTVGRDNVEPILSSPMYLWNLKLRAYDRFRSAAADAGVRTAVLRFEDFVQNSVLSLNRALTSMGVEPGLLKAIPGDTKAKGQPGRERRHFYLNELWREDLTSGAVSLINDMVDWDIAEAHGYAQLDPADFPDETETVGSDRKGRAATAA